MNTMSTKIMEVGAGLRYDGGKPRTDLLCPIALLGTASVLEFGAKKYASWNWAKGMAWSKVTASLLRHLLKFMMGEELDPETGLPHVDHIACNAMFLQNYFRLHKSLDDRPTALYQTETKKEGT